MTARSDPLGRETVRLAQFLDPQFEADIQSGPGGTLDMLECAQIARRRTRSADIELNDIDDGVGMGIVQLHLYGDPVAAELEREIRLPKRAIAQPVAEGAGMGFVRLTERKGQPSARCRLSRHDRAQRLGKAAGRSPGLKMSGEALGQARRIERAGRGGKQYAATVGVDERGEQGACRLAQAR